MQVNASGGTDHGHGSVLWLLGGGLSQVAVHDAWSPLSASTLDSGDVPGLNSFFGEPAQKRLGVGRVDTLFPGLGFSPLGVARAG